MNIVNNVFWITDREIDLLRATAALPFSLGGFDSLDSILTTLRVDVILEPGVIESQDYTILEKNLEFWKKAAERLKRHRERNAYSEELYQEALRNIEELNYELRVCPNYLLRGMYCARKNVIKLYPDEMQQEYGGQRMNELLISTLAHEAMHAYFDRHPRELFPHVATVEEPLAEFGMLLFLKETNNNYYQWAYDNVVSKETCYRYGAALMDRYEKGDKQIRQDLESYKRKVF